MQLFSANAKIYFFKLYFFARHKLKKISQKVTYGNWVVFFSAAPTAQNSSELHFRFINSFIQPSLLGSLIWIVELAWLKHAYMAKVFHLQVFRPTLETSEAGARGRLLKEFVRISTKVAKLYTYNSIIRTGRSTA